MYCEPAADSFYRENKANDNKLPRVLNPVNQKKQDHVQVKRQSHKKERKNVYPAH